MSLGETFDYVSAETLAATVGTTAGPQHPTFRYDIAGREDLILTHPRLPGVGYGRVQLDVPGWYFVRRADGTIAAETVSHGGEVLALEAGAYEITRRERASLEVAAIDVPTGGTIPVRASPARSVAFGRMVRKGGGPDLAYDLAASAAMRSALADLGPSVGAMFAARADFAAVSLELRLALGRAQNAGAHLEVTTWETSLGLAALRVFDIGWLRRTSVSAALGGEAGIPRLGERLDDGTDRVSWSPFAGPVSLADWAIARRLSLRAEVALPVTPSGYRPMRATRPRFGQRCGFASAGRCRFDRDRTNRRARRRRARVSGLRQERRSCHALRNAARRADGHRHSRGGAGPFSQPARRHPLD